MMSAWQSIETVPTGVHVLLYWPYGERGNGGIETATVYRGIEPMHDPLSFWTHGGPNSGADWMPANNEMPTHWMPLPAPPSISDTQENSDE